MKRTKKIKDLWLDVTKAFGGKYVPPDATKDAKANRAITTSIVKLHEKAKQGLTEDTAEGKAFLLRKKITEALLRNYCRSIRNIKNKTYLKKVKALTALVMGLKLDILDNDSDVSETALETLDVSTLEEQLNSADETVPDEVDDATAGTEAQTGAQQANT